MTMSRECMRCPVCGREDCISDFFILKSVPAMNNVVHDAYEQAVSAPVADLHFVLCEDCLHAWNVSHDSSKACYDEKYENNQYVSEKFRKHVDLVIDKIKISHDDKIVEVGCGQGYFLRRLVEKCHLDASCAIGFDPAVRNEENNLFLHSSLLDHRLFPEKFSPTMCISRHVIEHVADINGFLENICHEMRNIIKIVLETPSLEWIIENRAYHDMYHEHCSLFSMRLIRRFLGKFGFLHAHVHAVFEDQYLLAVGEHSSSGRHDGREKALDFSAFLHEFDLYRKHWKQEIMRLRIACEKIGIWGGLQRRSCSCPICMPNILHLMVLLT